VLATSRGRTPFWLLPARLGFAGWIILTIVNVLPLLTAPRAVQAHWLYPDNAFLEAEAIAARVAEVTPPGSRIFLAGAESEIALLSQRAPAGRYPLVYLLTPSDPTLVPEREAWLASLRDPRVSAVVIHEAPRAWIDAYGDRTVYAALLAAVRREVGGAPWRKDLVVPPFSLYCRRPP